jgi:hypothetical protein
MIKKEFKTLGYYLLINLFVYFQIIYLQAYVR